MTDQLETTRRGLHAVAELLVAGPQYAMSHDIRLRVAAGGFGTVATPDVRVEGITLVADGAVVPLVGTIADVGRLAGLAPRSLSDVYSDTAALGPDDRLAVDAECAAILADAFAIGDQAMRMLTPDEVPVLWPEHFDIGITVDEVNYGVSPGDAAIPEPYAYVGPWTQPHGPFWNKPFGAAVLLAELGGVVDVHNFFVRRRSEAQASM